MGRTPRRPAGRRNRRHGPSLWARLPTPRALAGRARRGLRASLPALAVVAALAVIAGGVHLGYRWMTGSERFAVAEIELRGNRTVTAARVHALIGDAVGENIFRVDLHALERQLEADPWIHSATVERRLPDLLEVVVDERQAAAVVELGGLYLADADGRPFKRADVAAGEGVGLPLITGLRRADYLRVPDGVAARVREGLDLLAAYAAGGARPAIGEIHFHPRQGATLYTRDTALAIRLGRPRGDETAARLAAFDVTWAALGDEERGAARIVHLDNRTRPDRVTVGFAEPPTPPSPGDRGEGSGG